MIRNYSLGLQKPGALVIFTGSPKLEARKKQILRQPGGTEKLLLHFIKRTATVVGAAQDSNQFDVIVSAENINAAKRFPIFSAADTNSPVFIRQRGKTFGERFEDCLRQTFKIGYKKVVVIGNDCPDLTPQIISKAFHELNSGSRITLGPSSDGGFYLLGLNEYDPELFNEIKWQTSSVFDTLVKNLNSTGLTPFLLPVLTDIDDFITFKKWLAANSPAARFFKQLLRKHGFNPLLSAFFLPLHKHEHLSKQLSQKSPPVFT